MAGRDTGIEVEGLREFRRDLKRISPEVNKEFAAAVKRAAEKVADDARSRAIHGKTGRYAASIRPYANGVIGSRLPQAGVLHWGGTIRPRGVAITFPERPVVIDAITRRTDQIVDDMGDAVDRAARSAGWT